MRAARGMVRIHASAIVRAIPHFTALVPMVVTTPMIDVQIICVVLTGIPTAEAPRIVAAPAVSAAKPCTGRSFAIFRPHRLDNTPSTGQGAESDRCMGDQDHPQGDGEVIGIDTGAVIPD